MKMTKHVGRIKNTGTRVIVVFRELPDSPKDCLICEIERLPDLLHDNIMEIVNSNLAQGTNDLYVALSQSKLNDGTNALETLHARKYLRKASVDEIELVPIPNRPVALAEINAAIAAGGVSEEAQANPAEAVVAETTQKQPTILSDKEKAEIAESMLMQAELLENDAKAKREQAEQLLKSVKADEPAKEEAEASANESDTTKKKETEKKVDRRKKTPEEKQKTKEAKLARRREAYRKKKEQQINEEIEKKVQEKILRDAGLLTEDNAKEESK